jgi:pimeloyl-ACP methyl ester carboxylesterase
MQREAETPGELPVREGGRACTGKGQEGTVPSENAVKVRKRHILYVHGYDPRGVKAYRRLFDEQHGAFCRLHGLEGKIGASEISDFAAAWNVTTAGEGWRVDTTYQFLGWEDLIRPQFSTPAPVKIFHAIRSLVSRCASGTLGAIVRSKTRFRFFFLYPFFLLLLEIIVALGLAVAVGGPLARWAGIEGAVVPVGAALFVVMLALLLKLTERRTFLLYLFALHDASLRYARRETFGWEQRFEAFASHLESVVNAADADEVVLVGHSLGAVTAIDCLVRALGKNPDLGTGGPRVVLCTLGGNVPVVGLDPAGGWLRERIGRLAGERSIRWVDFQSSLDVVGFGSFDPVAGHSIAVAGGRTNPVTVRVSFKESILPENYARFRLGFFGIHFQFLKSSERREGRYDYIRLCCGPRPFEEQARRSGWVVTVA